MIFVEKNHSELKENRARKRAIFFETVSKLLRNNVQNCVEMECETLQKLTKGISIPKVTSLLIQI